MGSVLYGTKAYGGTQNDGIVYSMNADGSNFQILAFVYRKCSARKSVNG